MFIMKNEKRQIMEGVELPSPFLEAFWFFLIRMLGEKENYKYLGILERTPSNKQMKKKVKSTPNEWENFSKPSFEVEISSKW